MPHAKPYNRKIVDTAMQNVRYTRFKEGVVARTWLYPDFSIVQPRAAHAMKP